MSREIVRRISSLKPLKSSKESIQERLRAAHRKMDQFLTHYQKNPGKQLTHSFLTQAIDGYINVIEANPKEEKAYLALAFMAWKSKNHDDAYILLKTVLNINFMNTRAQSMLKRLLFENPDVEGKANQSFEKLLRSKTGTKAVMEKPDRKPAPSKTIQRNKKFELKNNVSFPTKKEPPSGGSFSIISFD